MSTAERTHADEVTSRETIVAFRGREREVRGDVLAVEEPLEIRLAGFSVAVTMRTPGHDLDLAAGFLFTEGILGGIADIASLTHCPGDEPEGTSNIVNVNPASPDIVDPSRWQRNFYATSSCGICGKASIAGVRQEAPALSSSLRVDPEVLYGVERGLRQAQSGFQRTGALHAAGLFTADGQIVCLREDVGRHNAVDKVIGAMLRRGVSSLPDLILVVSSRASFEIVQKALMAGIPVVAAVSAASTLAVDLARSTSMTLIGFLRSGMDDQGRFNVYAGEERILL